MIWNHLLKYRLQFFTNVRNRQYCHYWRLFRVTLVVVTARNEVCEGYVLHVSVILSTGGFCSIACWDTPPDQAPRRPSPPRADPSEQAPPDQTPPEQTTPPVQCMLGDTVKSGRYASYWNAILFLVFFPKFLGGGGDLRMTLKVHSGRSRVSDTGDANTSQPAGQVIFLSTRPEVGTGAKGL